MKSARQFALNGIGRRQVLAVVTAMVATVVSLAIALRPTHDDEAPFYRALSLALGLSFGALYTRSAPNSGKEVPLINSPIHEAIHNFGWILYTYGGFWVVYDIANFHGGHVYGWCWLAGIPTGYLLGCYQPLEGAGSENWWLCEDTFIGWTRSSLRLCAISSIGFFALRATAHYILEPSPAVSWYSIGMMVAALVSLCHTWLAIPHYAPLRGTRVEQGAFRTNWNPVLS